MTARRAREWEPYNPARTDDLPLFAVVPIREMAHRNGPPTSKAAAIAISDHLSELQRRVYAAFQEHGSMSAKALEALPEMADLGFSTARKRASELLARGWLRDTGTTDRGCAVYGVAK